MVANAVQRDLVESLLAAYERTEPASRSVDTLSVSDGYEIQRAVVSARTAIDGPVVGYKLGFTNERIQRELGVTDLRMVAC